VIVTRMKVLVALSPGQVTSRNCCHLPAPSSSEASYSSPGMVCRPDSQITMWNPTAKI
jgi:hypothetical protein